MSKQLHADLSSSVAETRRVGLDSGGTLGAAARLGSIRHAVRSILSAPPPAPPEAAPSMAASTDDEGPGARGATEIETPGLADDPATAPPPLLTAPAGDLADARPVTAPVAPAPTRADMAAPPGSPAAMNIIHIGVQYMTTPADRAGNAASRIGRL